MQDFSYFGKGKLYEKSEDFAKNAWSRNKTTWGQPPPPVQSSMSIIKRRKPGQRWTGE
jgi:hypothetical protein